MKLSGQALSQSWPEPRTCAIAGKLARTYAMQIEAMAKLKFSVMASALGDDLRSAPRLLADPMPGKSVLTTPDSSRGGREFMKL